MNRFDPFPFSVSIRGKLQVPAQWFAFSVPREIWEGPTLCVAPPRMPPLPTVAQLNHYEYTVKKFEEQTRERRDAFVRNKVAHQVVEAMQVEWSIDEL